MAVRGRCAEFGGATALRCGPEQQHFTGRHDQLDGSIRDHIFDRRCHALVQATDWPGPAGNESGCGRDDVCCAAVVRARQAGQKIYAAARVNSASDFASGTA